MYSKLTITDGTERISFLTPDDRAGFNIESWRPGIAEYKGGGTWQDSPIADGRQLAYTQWANTVESWGFKAWADDADNLIRRMQDLKRLLIKAVEYWTTSWQTEPVWIEAVSPCETYTRYALIRWWALPEEEFPYGGVFYQATGGAAMDNLTLMLEHLHWTDTVPGVGTATAISAEQVFCYPWYLVCDGDTQSVDCGSDAGLDDLPDFAVAGKGQITVDGWIRADGYGEGNVGNIAAKLAAGVGWRIRMDNALGIYATVNCAAQSAISTTGLDEFTADGEWHHFVVTYDETGASTPAARTIYIAIDGVWVTSYPTQQASIGNYNPDAAGNLYLANISGGTAGFDGGMGWMRVSNSVHFVVGANFTVPPQCTFPALNTDTIGLWIREGDGTAIDNAEGTAARDGTAANDAWDCDCDSNALGRAATTSADEVFVANKHNMAQLTHILVYDSVAGAWDARNYANYGGAFSFDTLDDNAGSAMYFGIDTSAVNSGPFCSLVFDDPAGLLTNTNIWEYWNGAWVALSVQDNTNDDGAGTGVAFNTTGVKSVHWEQPSDWTPVDLIAAVGAGASGVTAYWVRCRVTAGAGAGTAVQTSRPIYTITWPYVNVAAAQVPGDIPALLRAVSRNHSDHNRSGVPEAWTNRIMVGLRSISRGATFTPYINLADEQNQSGITIGAVGTGAFATDARSPTGRIVRITNAAAAWTTQAYVSISSTLAQQYIGTFRWFLRGYQTSGAVGDMLVRLVINTPSSTGTGGGNFVTTNEFSFHHLNDFAYIDVGQYRLPLPGNTILPSETGDIYIAIQTYGDGAVDADLYDLIVMPVDEWAADFKDPEDLTANGIGYRSSTVESCDLDFGSILIPRNKIRAVRKNSSTEIVQNVYSPITNGPAILQQNADQRLWFLHLTLSDTAADDERAWVETSHTLYLQRQARYLGQRGAR